MIDYDVIVENSLKNDPLKNSIFSSVRKNLEKSEYSINELLEAFKKEEITKDELLMELEREKEMFEAELISYQITTNDEAIKISNSIFSQIEQSL